MLQSSSAPSSQHIFSHRFGPAHFSSGNYACYRNEVSQWAESVARRIRRVLSSKKYPWILDVRCAYGHLIAVFQDKFGAEVAGLAYSPRAIAHAVASVRRHIQLGDMRRNQFLRMYRFDAVICLDVFQYLTE